MTKRLKTYLRIMLIAAFAAGMVFSPSSRTVSHDFSELVKIIADHHVEIEAHGHVHEDIADLLHAYHGHAHEAADHDHNVAFVLPRPASNMVVPNEQRWIMRNTLMPDLGDYGWERPPRV